MQHKIVTTFIAIVGIVTSIVFGIAVSAYTDRHFVTSNYSRNTPVPTSTQRQENTANNNSPNSGAQTTPSPVASNKNRNSSVTTPTPLPTGVLPRSQYPASYQPVLISQARIDELKNRVRQKTQPNYRAWQDLIYTANTNLNRQPHLPPNGYWYVPLRYVDEQAHLAAKQGLMDDSNIAFKLAVAYRITGDEKYAAAAARLIHGWSVGLTTYSAKGTADDSMLAFSVHFSSFIYAADLLRTSNNYTQAYRQEFESFLRNKALKLSTIRVISYGKSMDNNWASWGVCLNASIGSYLNDAGVFNDAVSRHKELTQLQMTSTGVLKDEVTRQNGVGDKGLWYTNLTLIATVNTLEVMRIHGADLYGYVSSNGNSWKKAYQVSAPWVKQPSSFDPGLGVKTGVIQTEISNYVPFYEILNQRWYNSSAAAVITQGRPYDSIYPITSSTFLYANLPANL